MKRPFFVALLLVSILQAAGFSATPVRRTSRSSRKPKKKPFVPRVDPTEGDYIDGDDLTIRRAAVDALGPQEGSVVVVDPNTGRILTMVNQKLALQSGFTPCSTIKLVTALAALNEHVVERDANVYISRRVSFNLTTAIAHSNNPYFGILGTRLGFDRVMHYAHMFGLGEKAGLEVTGEQPGLVPDGPPRAGGMGLLTAYGEGFQMTPLELAALMSSIANGGTLYYLQYPRTPEEIEHFTPQIKRTLDIAANEIADLKLGMRGAVDYGTARRANYDPNEQIFGKTGTCTDFRAGNHMGWFGSFIEDGGRQLVVVVMLMGNHAISGPVASGVAGAFYRNLSEQRYFAAAGDAPKKNGLPDIIATTPCCHQ